MISSLFHPMKYGSTMLANSLLNYLPSKFQCKVGLEKLQSTYDQRRFHNTANYTKKLLKGLAKSSKIGSSKQ